MPGGGRLSLKRKARLLTACRALHRLDVKQVTV